MWQISKNTILPTWVLVLVPTLDCTDTSSFYISRHQQPKTFNPWPMRTNQTDAALIYPSLCQSISLSLFQPTFSYVPILTIDTASNMFSLNVIHFKFATITPVYLSLNIDAKGDHWKERHVLVYKVVIMT